MASLSNHLFRVKSFTELFPHKADKIQIHGNQLLEYDHMLSYRVLSKLTHVPQHRCLQGSLHGSKIVQRRGHARRIGIVGILDQDVPRRLLQLRAVVLRNIFTHSLDGIFERNSEM